MIRLRSEQNRDVKKLFAMCRAGEFASRRRGDGSGSTFKVNDLVLFNGSKTFGHVIQVLDESLRIVDDSNQVRRINLKDVDKKIERNRGAIARDEAGNVLQVEDVVRCNTASGSQQGKKGIIVNICRSCLFLWDPKDFENSNGVFAERAMHVMILGNEFLEGVATDSGVMTQNRIMRDKLLHRRVQIVKGTFKGYRGIVSGVHGEEAIVELASKAKKVSVPKSIVEEIEADGSTTYDLQMSDNTRPQNTAG